MKTQRLILTLLALTFALAPQSPRTAFAEPKKEKDYSAKLISPKPGEVLRPGQVVRIEWTAVFPQVDPTMCETEILISVDGGKTYTYVTSQRNPKVQYYNWTVPETPTKTAILDIRFGCLGIYPETFSPQVQSAFVISAISAQD
jgi:hypothetical protein